MQTPVAALLPGRGELLRSAHRLLTAPGALLLALLLLNAIFRPYAGFKHDACLYALQVVHRAAPELHAEDLFLKYGSQDSYSAFSLLASPLVKTIGIDATFFLLYVGGTACWLFAMYRFLLVLQGRNIAALGAMVYVAVNPLPFGGYHIFQVNETFLTPRLWAVALVVLALERLLRGRNASSLAWMGASMLLHPIMGFCGLCIWVLYQLQRKFSPRVFLLCVSCGTAAAACVLLYEPLGTAAFGHIDDEWRECVTAANSYSVPAEWPLKDWIAAANAFAIIAAGRIFIDLKPSSRRLLDAVMLLAAAGLAIGLVAPVLPYRLLIQGQAYRALWPLQFVQIPILFALIGSYAARRLSTDGNRAAIAVLCSFSLVSMTISQIVAGLLLAAAAHFWQQAVREIDQARSRRLQRRALLAFSASVAISAAAVVAAYPILREWCDPLVRVAAISPVVGPMVAWSAAAYLLISILRVLRIGVRLQCVAACGWLGIQSVFCVVPASSLYERVGVEDARDVAFVQDYLANEYASVGRTPVLYWPIGPLDGIWLRLRCNSFYSVPQTAGNMFNRGTAIEGQRRARLARDFELDVRQKWLELDPDGLGRQILRNFGNPSQPGPTVADLLALCSEEGVDFVVVPHQFDGWQSATNGHLYIYDARRIREALQTTALQARNSASVGYPGSSGSSD